MEIINSVSADIDSIFELYEEGTKYQKLMAPKHWKGFERPMVEEEIAENRQWKILINGEIACVFATTFHDPLIWREKDNDPSLYIHRIATNPAFRGRGLVKQIVAWAKAYAIAHGKKYLRMDTGSGNEKLNNYYVSCGFTYMGVTNMEQSEGLPAHYKNGSFSLFEIIL